MPQTVEQRSQANLCGARKKNGELCRQYAGAGTEHQGIGRCRWHLGNTSSHNRNAIEREAKQRLVRHSEPMENVRPHQVLLWLLGQSAGQVAQLMSEVAELEDLGTEEAKVILRLFDSERDRLARIAKSCSETGVEEADVAIRRVEAELMAGALQQSAADIGLNPDQVKALATAWRMRSAESEGDEAEVARQAEILRERVERIQAADARRVQREAQKIAGLVPAEELGVGAPLPAPPAGA